VLLYQYSPVAPVPNRLGRSRAISCFPSWCTMAKRWGTVTCQFTTVLPGGSLTVEKDSLWNSNDVIPDLPASIGFTSQWVPFFNHRGYFPVTINPDRVYSDSTWFFHSSLRLWSRNAPVSKPGLKYYTGTFRWFYLSVIWTVNKITKQQPKLTF